MGVNGVKHHGDSGVVATSGCKIEELEGKIVLTKVLEGSWDNCVAYAKPLTVTVEGVTAVTKQFFKQRQPGARGQITIIGEKPVVLLSPQESTEIEVSLDVSWMARSVPLTDAQRVAPISGGYSYPLLEAWKSTPLNLKNDFIALVPEMDVGNFSGDYITVEDAKKFKVAKYKREQLSKYPSTLLVAQRIFVGMENYESYYPVVTITKRWHGMPKYLIQPGTQGAPPAPFVAADFDLGGYSWLCSGANHRQHNPRDWTSVNTFTGLRSNQIPNPKPEEWGNTPFDGLFYNAGSV